MTMFKPMLAVDCGDITQLKFPLIASPKLDGVRAMVQEGKLYSRTLKLIPNVHVQRLFRGLPNGLDGELIAGDPCAPDTYRKTVSLVMSDDKPLDNASLLYHAFDCISPRTTTNRLSCVAFVTRGLNAVQCVPQTFVRTMDELLALESKWTGQGYEGVMLRDPASPYKHGRSTLREGYLLKLKRFADSEATVLDLVELMHNGNDAKKNALGRTERSTAKVGLTGRGMLGALKVRDVMTGVEFEIGTGFTEVERRALWSATGVVGRLAKYKYFAGGSKDKPRFPVFLGWRDKRDV